jgi:hypothetical protein
MKNWLIILLVFSPLLGQSQGRLLTSLLKTVPKADTEVIDQKMADFVASQDLKLSKTKSEIKFLRILFNESHRKFLKTYKPYSQFNEIFESGHYDCLTGTAFFSLVLESLKFEYIIVETNYHIFLLVHTREGRVLLETTDRLFGFKTNPAEIDNSLRTYKENQLTASAPHKGGYYYQYQASLFREIKSIQLSGLLYFNQAVVAYNNRDWVACVDSVVKARYIYDNARIEELTQLLASSISISELNEKTKQELLIQLGEFAPEIPVLAVR